MNLRQALGISLVLLLGDLFRAAFIVQQGILELGKNRVGNLNILQNSAQFIAQFVFPEIR
jgi:hypothetical protein